MENDSPLPNVGLVEFCLNSAFAKLLKRSVLIYCTSSQVPKNLNTSLQTKKLIFTDAHNYKEYAGKVRIRA